jgi:hypothetical protein
MLKVLYNKRWSARQVISRVEPLLVDVFYRKKGRETLRYLTLAVLAALSVLASTLAWAGEKGRPPTPTELVPGPPPTQVVCVTVTEEQTLPQPFQMVRIEPIWIPGCNCSKGVYSPGFTHVQQGTPVRRYSRKRVCYEEER